MNIIPLPIKGKRIQQIAKEYKKSDIWVRKWAKENNVPCISIDGINIDGYVFDKESELKFASRDTTRGRPKKS